jgi:hypothetical protein
VCRREAICLCQRPVLPEKIVSHAKIILQTKNIPGGVFAMTCYYYFPIRASIVPPSPRLRRTEKKINNKMFKTLANWKIVSIFAPRFLDEIAKQLKKQTDRWIH